MECLGLVSLHSPGSSSSSVPQLWPPVRNLRGALVCGMSHLNTFSLPHRGQRHPANGSRRSRESRSWAELPLGISRHHPLPRGAQRRGGSAWNETGVRDTRRWEVGSGRAPAPPSTQRPPHCPGHHRATCSLGVHGPRGQSCPKGDVEVTGAARASAHSSHQPAG